MGDNIGKNVYRKLPYNVVSLTMRLRNLDPKHRDISREQFMYTVGRVKVLPIWCMSILKETVSQNTDQLPTTLPFLLEPQWMGTL